MAVLKHGWSEQIALSLFLKESAYDTAPTINSTNYCSLNGFEAEVSWPDTFETDKGEVTGKEHGYDQYRVTQQVNINVTEAHAKPNTLAGLGQLALGSAAVTKDGAVNAWRHILTPIAVGSALPSIGVVHQKGGVQYKYSGAKCNSLALTAEIGMAAKMSAELIGSGTRATDATGFPAVIADEWMLVRNCKVWMESGADISISATPTQGTEDISSATPDSLDVRMKNFSWKWNNGLERQSNFGSASGAARDIDKGRRSAELSLGLIFNDATELNYFINQDVMAVELDLAGSIIAAGAYKYGCNLVIPRCKVKSAPVASGGVDDILEVTMEFEVFDDGTNPASILTVYTNKAAYLA